VLDFLSMELGRFLRFGYSREIQSQGEV